ncbi:MAG: FHA domain-containing protein, partial [Deltaproteobacteria bacterium]
FADARRQRVPDAECLDVALAGLTEIEVAELAALVEFAQRLEGAREPEPRSHTTTLRPAPHTTDLDALRPSAAPPWVRLVIRSPEGSVEHRLARADLRGLVLVGRYSRCQAAHGGLLEGDVSRVHAGVIARGDGVEVIDLASTNGISVDGQKVRRVLVERAATVRLGKKGCAIEIARF